MKDFPEKIRFFLSIFEGRAFTLEECGEMSDLLGSREEFVAHVLLRRPAFKIQQVQAALANLQSTAPGMSISVMCEAFDDGNVKKGRVAMEGVIAKLIAQDLTAKPVADLVAKTLRDIAITQSNPLTRLNDPFLHG